MASVHDTMFANKSTMPEATKALPDRSEQIEISGLHFVNGTSILPPFPEGTETAYFGMGCFWGAEREFWTIPGVYTTAVGYQGGFTANATYSDVCSGKTGHAEMVLVVYDPAAVEYEKLLATFWEAHDPTQGMRQGNDRGTQYRSAIFTTSPEQEAEAKASRDDYAERLADAGYGPITTEFAGAGPFYYAEDYHQQYLAKNPNGYCGLEGTGVACAIGLDLN